MSSPVRFLLEATAELEDALRWYEQRRRGLGLSFLAAVDAAIEFVARWPEAGAPVTGVGADLDIRRVRVGRFPYQLAYMRRGASVHVLAVAHDRRRPHYWHQRTDL